MPRAKRIELPGATYHVYSRGNAREAIVRDDHDRRSLRWLVGRTVTKFGWICHAWAMVDNHLHLFIETPEPNLSRGMRHLNGSHATRYNLRHDRTGHVFEGPYDAVLVTEEEHFVWLTSYVPNQPVEAGLCRKASEWKWSSFRATVGLEAEPPWLDTAKLLARFDGDRDRYRRYVEGSAPGDPPRDLFSSDNVAREGARDVSRAEQVPSGVADGFAPGGRDLFSPAKDSLGPA